ncbi:MULTISPECIES: LysE/ArgO family amino acid transporter [Campylobacter]|uniref:LysE/ArgO family amino acid transporter n=1 Tax=Campylobacter TaxID=194 RepID=UPI00027A36F3|nr:MULTISPECIES: LysE/ArgO family amino acid transporter [Campylobacter]EJP74740.1 L-lysine exporter [Campylobacter sp. FOBRC14]
MSEILLRGFLLGASLIIAIGAQNIFVLKQSLSKNHIFAICLTCALCDTVLLSMGVYGVGETLGRSKIFSIIIAVLGAIFLFAYGALALRSAFKAQSEVNLNAQKTRATLKTTLAKTLAITLLNPHVYIDTVVIVGGIAATIPASQKAFFLLGAVVASFAWFFALGYGAKAASVLFKSPKTWCILDLVTAAIMFYIGALLVKFVIENL